MNIFLFIYYLIVLLIVIFILINKELSSVNTNYLCSSSLGYKVYKNYKNTCKLNCKLEMNYTFPTYINESCYKMKLYVMKHKKYFSLFSLNISNFSYDSKYLYSEVINVYSCCIL